MQTLSFSPLDGRYKKKLVWELSEEASLDFQKQIEKKWLMALMKEELCPQLAEEKLDEIFSSVAQAQVDEIEKTTRHATRALVEAMANSLTAAGHPDIAQWVHVGLTSFDTVDSAQRLRLKAYFENAALKKIESLQSVLASQAEDYEKTPQVGRTHGQWAVPTYFGLAWAEAWVRIDEILPRLRGSLANLRLQASGAIGGYHAPSLLVDDPIEFEKKWAQSLGLSPHYGSIQILPPEDILSVAQDSFQIASVVSKLATDFRHLARSEINEVQEGMAPGQVGSSTMPQKRNPWNLEHICSLQKILSSRLQLIENDLVTEHQRDLTNSASGRFYFEFFSVFHLILARALEVFPNLEVNQEQMAMTLKKAGSSVLGEAFYVTLCKNGVKDAHSVVREAARRSEKSGNQLWQELVADGKLAKDFSVEELRQKCLRGSELKFKAIAKRWKV